MKTILVTGGTIFVSRFIAEYYVKKGFEVYVLNRNTKEQSKGVKLIEADRHSLKGVLKNHHFDIIVDTAYSAIDIDLLLNDVGSFDDYFLISSSAVYPEDQVQPFAENTPLGLNKYWGKYGTDKISAENTLLEKCPNAYILRPPYLYGPYNNVYREGFVFDCAMQDRKFYLPRNSEMNLQFFHVQDMCKFIDILMKEKPDEHIFNLGNEKLISVADWVRLCYNVVGKEVEFVNVSNEFEQRNYFSFYNYQYSLDVSRQCYLMTEYTSLKYGLEECFKWYKNNSNLVNKKPFFEYIDKHFA